MTIYLPQAGGDQANGAVCQASRQDSHAEREVRDSAVTKQLVAEADRLRGYVARRMWGYQSEVDDVMQVARMRLWRSSSAYDPARGGLKTFARRVVANVVTDELRRLQREPRSDPLPEWVHDEQPGPLADLIDEFSRNRLIRLIADHSSQIEWDVFSALVRRDGDARAAAAQLGLPLRTVGAARERVRVLVRTAIAAFGAVDAGADASAAACLPAVGGVREVAEVFDMSTPRAARQLAITIGVFRTRRALVRRSLVLAAEILTDG